MKPIGDRTRTTHDRTGHGHADRAADVYLTGPRR